MTFWQAPEWVACPHCHIGYQCAKIGVNFDQKRQYTIICINKHCGKSCDVDVEPKSLSKPTMKVTAR